MLSQVKYTRRRYHADVMRTVSRYDGMTSAIAPSFLPRLVNIIQQHADVCIFMQRFCIASCMKCMILLTCAWKPDCMHCWLAACTPDWYLWVNSGCMLTCKHVVMVWAWQLPKIWKQLVFVNNSGNRETTWKRLILRVDSEISHEWKHHISACAHEKQKGRLIWLQGRI